MTTHPDSDDFSSATRGLIASLKPCVIKNSTGRVVWNNDAYDFLHTSECPSSANPGLWRQGRLTSIQGLFEIIPGIYQVRGLDLSNMTIVEGNTGVVVIDPLTSVECAAAALGLYREHRGDRPVTAVIYSHSHVDHFGGAAGVLGDTSDAPILAPEGFMDEATGENIFVGEAMRRRAAYMYGSALPKGPDGQIGCGLGMTVSTGTLSLIPPNMIIRRTGEERVLDGVRIQFQMVPDTEAPAEMNFFFPDHGALCIAECATHGLHNIITLRGALVRDAKSWARYLDETLVLYGNESQVLFAGHTWPTWGRENIARFVSEQRDLYAYLHDQTVRMMNLGMNGTEIAEVISLPPTLQTAWHAQGYYGSVSHNVKGIYQRYMGWFDGNPAHLWDYPTAELGKRYVDCFGGVDQILQKAAEYERNDDLRFAATLLGHAVSAQPEHRAARTALASVFEKLGYGCENATWRNFYLTEVRRLRSSGSLAQQKPSRNEINPSLSMEQLLTLLSIRIDGPRAAAESFVIDVQMTDEQLWWRMILSNGVLTSRRSVEGFHDTAGLAIITGKTDFVKFLNGRIDALQNPAKGDMSLLHKLLSLAGLSRDPHSAL